MILKWLKGIFKKRAGVRDFTAANFNLMADGVCPACGNDATFYDGIYIGGFQNHICGACNSVLTVKVARYVAQITKDKAK